MSDGQKQKAASHSTAVLTCSVYNGYIYLTEAAEEDKKKYLPIFITIWACQTLAILLNAHTNTHPQPYGSLFSHFQTTSCILMLARTHTHAFALQATGARLIVTPAVAEMEILMK